LARRLSRHSGAPQSGEPGIHNHGNAGNDEANALAPWLWIPGSSLTLGPGMTLTPSPANSARDRPASLSIIYESASLSPPGPANRPRPMQPGAENVDISAQTGGFDDFHVKGAPIRRPNK